MEAGLAITARNANAVRLAHAFALGAVRCGWPFARSTFTALFVAITAQLLSARLVKERVAGIARWNANPSVVQVMLARDALIGVRARAPACALFVASHAARFSAVCLSCFLLEMSLCMLAQASVVAEAVWPTHADARIAVLRERAVAPVYTLQVAGAALLGRVNELAHRTWVAPAFADNAARAAASKFWVATGAACVAKVVLVSVPTNWALWHALGLHRLEVFGLARLDAVRNCTAAPVRRAAFRELCSIHAIRRASAWAFLVAAKKAVGVARLAQKLILDRQLWASAQARVQVSEAPVATRVALVWVWAKAPLVLVAARVARRADSANRNVRVGRVGKLVGGGILLRRKLRAARWRTVCNHQPRCRLDSRLRR